jgi:polyisoprenoid-binding protein YceI
MNFFALFLALALPGAAPAATAPLDAGASTLKFTGHAFLHSFDGQAQEFEGGARLDPANPNLVSEAFLDVAAGRMTTFQDTRDKNMRAWLHTDADPRIEFHLSRIECLSGDPAKAGPDHPASFAVSGEFTLNRTTQPLCARVLGWRERRTLVVTGTTTLNTIDYGLPIIRQLFMTVDPHVDVSFRLVFDLPEAGPNAG